MAGCKCLIVTRIERKKKGRETGVSKMPEYFVWAEMRYRCNRNVRHARAKDYSQRGIGVSKEWAEDFSNFIADMGPRPSGDHSLDRIDNDRGYCKHNCKWATRLEQARNKRNSVNSDLPHGVRRDAHRGYKVHFWIKGESHYLGVAKTLKQATAIAEAFKRGKQNGETSI